jgi:thioesterase domain-containing protein
MPMTLRANDPTTGFLKAWRSYAPKHSEREVVLFRTRERGPEYDRDLSMGWNACVKSGVQVHVVPGGHLDMMTMPAVGVIAEKVAKYMQYSSNQSDPVGTSGIGACR